MGCRYMDAEILLEKILNIPSVNGKDDEGAVARFIASYLHDCGLETRIQKIDETHSNVIAVLKGKSPAFILWNGHIDTVPYGDLKAWDHNPAVAVRMDDRIYARGASDMKSGLAAMVYVLGELGRQKFCPEKTIVFLGSCDEEKNGLGARYFLEQEEMQSPELLLIGEPTACNLGIAQKGCMWLNLKVEGSASHSAEPERGANAIEQGVLLLLELKNWIRTFSHKILGNATMQINLCSGGTAPNMTADLAEFTVDIRLIPGMSDGQVLTKVQELVNKFTGQNHNPIRFYFEVENNRPAVELAEDSEWIARFKELPGVSEGADTPLKLIGINYFTDASVLCEKWKNLPVLLLGPGEPDMCHKANEYVQLGKYSNVIAILFQLCNNI